jgi:hypothetical protein
MPARRCIVPVAGFFEWKAIKGQKVAAFCQEGHEGPQMGGRSRLPPSYLCYAPLRLDLGQGGTVLGSAHDQDYGRSRPASV